MNLLAHAHLSFENQHLLLGNMISDHVKGRKQYDYPDAVRAGISLHRAIDDFTDTHPLIRELKTIFQPAYRLYASPISDVVLDHFLANDQGVFPHADQLERFTFSTYAMLDETKDMHPANFARMFSAMKRDNWLYHYRFDHGIARSLDGLRYRSKFLGSMEEAFSLFTSHKDTIRDIYSEFYPDVKKFARKFAGPV